MKTLTVIIPVYNQEDLIFRALDSVPKLERVDIIVVNDGSTDNTNTIIKMYIEDNPDQKIMHITNTKNRGVAFTINRALDVATGDYIVLLGSDDYFIPEGLIKVMKSMNTADLIYFNLEINSGKIFELLPATKNGYCGSVKLMRREFIGDTRNQIMLAGEDWNFNNMLLAKNPTEIFTHIVAKHYNYPRKGSLIDIYGNK